MSTIEKSISKIMAIVGICTVLLSVGGTWSVGIYRQNRIEDTVKDLGSNLGKQIESVRSENAKQVADLKLDYSQRIDKIDNRLNTTDADGRETVRLEEQNRLLSTQLGGLRDDLKMQTMFTQTIKEQLAAMQARYQLLPPGQGRSGNDTSRASNRDNNK